MVNVLQAQPLADEVLERFRDLAATSLTPNLWTNFDVQSLLATIDFLHSQLAEKERDRAFHEQLYSDALRTVEALRTELDEARATNQRLNRRIQRIEAAIIEEFPRHLPYTGDPVEALRFLLQRERDALKTCADSHSAIRAELDEAKKKLRAALAEMASAVLR